MIKPDLLPDINSELAAERTELALERTHLAWIRTVVTLLTSGFAIDKLLEVIHAQRIIAGKALTTKTHFTGFFLVIGGMFLLIAEGVYYVRRSAELAELRNGRSTHLLRGLFLSTLLLLTAGLLLYLIIDTDF
jgi:putative membrane protein